MSGHTQEGRTQWERENDPIIPLGIDRFST